VANPRFYADRIMLAVDDVSRADPSFDLEAMLHIQETSYVSSFANSTASNLRPHAQHAVVTSLRNILTEKVQNRTLVHTNLPNISTPHTRGVLPRFSLFGNITHISQPPLAANLTENIPLTTYPDVDSRSGTMATTLSSTASQQHAQVAIDEGTSTVKFVSDSTNMASFENPLAKKSDPFENADWTA